MKTQALVLQLQRPALSMLHSRFVPG